jgi:hypothetical protein
MTFVWREKKLRVIVAATFSSEQVMEHQVDDEAEEKARRPQRYGDTSHAWMCGLSYIVGRNCRSDHDGVKNEGYTDGGEYHVYAQERQVDVAVKEVATRKLRQTEVRETEEVKREKDEEKGGRRSHETRMARDVSASYLAVSGENGYEGS